MIKFFEFLDGTKYCLARDIIDCARIQGYEPVISTDGRVHPGTICNNTLRRVIKDPGLRRKFSISPKDVVQINDMYIEGNKHFINYLIRNSFISINLIASGHLDLYSLNACQAILSLLLGEDVEVTLESEDIRFIAWPVFKEEKSLEKGKLRPKVSLFRRT